MFFIGFLIYFINYLLHELFKGGLRPQGINKKVFYVNISIILSYAFCIFLLFFVKVFLRKKILEWKRNGRGGEGRNKEGDLNKVTS